MNTEVKPSINKTTVNQFFVLLTKNGKTIKVEDNMVPTEILDYPFLFYQNTDIAKLFTHLIPQFRGNWVMYFNHAEGFDQKWKDCCKLYNDGSLTGVRSLKCSTGYKNPKTKDHTLGAIFFICGPTNDRFKILEFGNNLLKYIPYWNDLGHMVYTELTSDNPLYKISVPENKSFNVNDNQFFVWSETDKAFKIYENKKPTEILDYHLLKCVNMYIYNSLIPYQNPVPGQWTMFFEHEKDFDQKWELCCKLYAESKLTGIQQIRCSTGLKNPKHCSNNNNIGRILFRCGPPNDKTQILEYGKHLLKHIPYYHSSGFMQYDDKVPIERSIKDIDNSYFSYRIPVPKDESFEIKVNRLFLNSKDKKEIEIGENKLPSEMLDSNDKDLFYENIYIDIDFYNNLSCEELKFWGNWIMEFKCSEDFDQKWKDCCKLYDEGKLTGIQHLRCTSSFKDPRKSGCTTGDILFYCESTTDERSIGQFGKNLLKHIPYCNDSGFMCFIGQTQNNVDEAVTDNFDKFYMYKIIVPKSHLKVNRISLMPMPNGEEDCIEIDENKIPTQILDFPYLCYTNIPVFNSFPYCDSKLLGKWMMFFKRAEDYDQKWEDCCKLYDEGKLTGIRSLKCSTGYKNPRATDHDSGVILFYCGPINDKSKMLEFGRNLLKYISYYSDYGHMAYKSNEQTYKGTRATGNRDNFLYRIPVPKHPKINI